MPISRAGGGAPTEHTHAEADVTGLVTDLAGKADDGDISTLTTAVGGKAATVHTHPQSDVTSLVTDLAGKADSDHTHVDPGYIAGAFVFSIPGVQAVTSVSARRYNNTGNTLTITKVQASVSTAPVGAGLVLDVKKNGTTIFTSAGERTTVAAGAYTGSSVPTAITTWAADEYMEVFVTQVGSTTPGSNLTGEVVCQG